jgi:serine protease Do
MSMLDELESSIATVAAGAGPSIVRLGRWRGGSGVVVSQGAVLTNAHNVREGMTVTFADGRQAEAKLAGIDVDGDLAVLAVDTGDAPAIERSDRAAAIGMAVFAATAHGSGVRVTFGLVSSVARAFRGPRGRRISGAVEHTAPLAPGSSGSALVDRDGRLVGLNTNRVGNGFYLALPADETLEARIDALRRGESAERPRLGIAIAPSRVANRMRRAVGLPEREGVLVREVEPDSPAARAGIREGDMIFGAGEHLVAEPDDIYDALGGAERSAMMPIRLARGADELTVEVTFDADGSGRETGPVH